MSRGAGCSMDGGSATGIAARLASLVERQHALLVELESWCRRQSSLVEADAADELVSHLEARQALVERVVEVSAELEPFRSRWESLLSVVPEAERGRLTGLLESSSALAARIRASDEADRARLASKRSALREEMLELDRGRGAIGAYGASAEPSGPMFQDREA